LIVYPVSASPKVVFNGSLLSFDVPPQNVNGRLLVPLRVIFEALGASVEWNDNTKSISAKGSNIEIVITIGELKGFINGQTVELNTPAQIIGGRTLVPLRFVSEAFGATVDWDGETETVTIFKEGVKLSTTELAKLVNTVVTVKTKLEGQDVIGSGVLISSDGLIVTNCHVIGENNEGRIILTGSKMEYTFEVFSRIEDYDIAILYINKKDLPYAKLGDSEKIQVGQDVVSIGNPLNFDSTMSTGIISGIRQIEYLRLIQITTPITFGSSGGGLFDYYGNLVGITTLGVGLGDLNFAIPINDVSRFLYASINFGNDDVKIPQEIIEQIPGYWSLSPTSKLLFSESSDPNNSEFIDRIPRNAERIYWHLNSVHNPPNKLVVYTVKAKYYRAVAENLFEPFTVEEEVSGYACPTWDGSFLTNKIPSNLIPVGVLDIGKYKVELYCEDRLITSGTFEIY
jgi:S1-C subfamily serine protease